MTHHATLSSVFEILSSNGITLNRSKCIFASPSLEFLGHLLSSTGISPSLAKVEAIKNMPIPQNKDQLHSFLGLANYVCQKLVPNFASLAAPLWSLCSKDSDLDWHKNIKQTFGRLCSVIVNCTGTVWFMAHKPIQIQTDASAMGLVVAYYRTINWLLSCHKLTPSETHYSAI